MAQSLFIQQSNSNLLDLLKRGKIINGIIFMSKLCEGEKTFQKRRLWNRAEQNIS